MRFFGPKNPVARATGLAEIAKPHVTEDEVRLRLGTRDATVRPSDRNVTIYLTKSEAQAVGRLVDMVARKDRPTAMICEAHPTEAWPHEIPAAGHVPMHDCIGPGMPWRNALRLLKEALAEVRMLDLSLATTRRRRDELEVYRRATFDTLSLHRTMIDEYRREAADLRRELDEARSPESEVAGTALEDAEEGDWIHVRLDSGNIPAVQRAIENAIFYRVDMTLTPGQVPLTDKIQLHLEGARKLPEPEAPPSVQLRPYTGYKQVDLTYFTEAGKRYTEGKFWTPQGRLDFQVYATVETLRADGRLPGLTPVSTWSYGAILVRPEGGVEALLPATERADDDDG